MRATITQREDPDFDRLSRGRWMEVDGRWMEAWWHFSPPRTVGEGRHGGAWSHGAMEQHGDDSLPKLTSQTHFPACFGFVKRVRRVKQRTSLEPRH